MNPRHTTLLLAYLCASLLSFLQSYLELTFVPGYQYFSSLERLRLAQHGRHTSKPTYEFLQRFVVKTSYRPTCRFNHRVSASLDKRLARSSNAARNRLRKPVRQLNRSRPINQHEIDLFASLPSALRRKQYSREEQVLLASRIHNVILDASDEVLFRRHRSLQSQSLSVSISWSQFESDSEQLSTAESQFDLASKPAAEEAAEEEEEAEEMSVSQSDLEAFRWLDEPEALDLSLYDYHTAVAETALKNDTPMQHHLIRNSLSMPRLSFQKRSSSKLSSYTITPPALQGSSKATGGHSRNKASVSSIEPAAAHYQDPTARMKLRVYLASPQKFDEAVEFGFPSMQEQSKPQHHRPRPTLGLVDDIANTFYDDDTPSLSDGEDRDVGDFDSPRTPSASAFSSAFTHGPSIDTSLDRASFRPKLTKDTNDTYVFGSNTNREMTLHMTLTRPDLRSPTDEHFPNPINSIPLEQPPMKYEDDLFWDSLPDEESKVRKLLRKLKFRS